MVDASPQPGQEAEEVEAPSEVYEADSNILMNDKEFNFSCANPQNQGGTVFYDVKGVDNDGAFECKKRYSEFDTLDQALRKRWPCVPIPPLPPKAMKNTEKTFLSDRQFYLQRWLRKTSRFQFIVDSDEFKAFSRPAGGMKLDSALGKMLPLTTNSKLERMVDASKCDPSGYEASRKEGCAQKIVEFMSFTKKIEPCIKSFRGTLAKQVTNKHVCNIGYKEQAIMLDRYEEFNLSHYTDAQAGEMIMTNAANKEVRTRMDTTAAGLRNPYIDLYQWCKGEMYDLASIANAINVRKEHMEKLRELMTKKTSTQKSLDNATAGKKNIMGSNDSGVLATQIEATDREIETMKKLIDWMTVFLGEVVIGQFKLEKGDLYKRLLQQFCVNEIQNSHNLAQLYSAILQMEKVKAH